MSFMIWSSFSFTSSRNLERSEEHGKSHRNADMHLARTGVERLLDPPQCLVRQRVDLVADLKGEREREEAERDRGRKGNSWPGKPHHR